MALLSGGVSTAPSASANLPFFSSGPTGNYVPPNFQRKQSDELEHQLYYHTGGGSAHGGNHASNNGKEQLKEKINYIKHLIKDKFRKKLAKGGHEEHEVKDYGTAISALTLLAFLFFLYILQSCIKDHMNQMASDATTTTASPAAYQQYREQRRRSSKVEDTVQGKSTTLSADDRRGETPDFEIYDDYEEEEITTKPPKRRTTKPIPPSTTTPKPRSTTQTVMSAYEVYRKTMTNRNYDQDTHYSYMEPVKLIVKSN